MPELPEVETVVRELKCLEGEQLSELNFLWAKTFDAADDGSLECLKGQSIEKVSRRGKYIIWHMSEGDHLSIHLRMTGKMLFECSGKDQKFLRAEMSFASGKKVFFVDIRKFGRIKHWLATEALLPKLGPEPLASKDVQRALSRCSSRRAIKKVLLDQNVLVGVGNIYADEALFASGIHPTRSCSALKPEEIKALSVEIPRILKASIANMGTTLSDYRNTKNIGGENQNYLKVYGQAGHACEVCGTGIVKMDLGGRGTHFCPTCQLE